MVSYRPHRASVLAVAACLLVLLLPACGSSQAASPPLAVIGEITYESPLCCTASVSTDDGAYLYVMSLGVEDEPAELHVLEVGDGGSPTEISSLQAPVEATPFGMEWWKVSPAVVANERLYIPLFEADHGGIWVLDISDPEAPAEVNFVETDVLPTSLSLAGTTAAAATHSFTDIVLFDLSNPDEPQLTTTFQHGGRSTPVTVLVGDTVYVYSVSGVGIFDVSDINAPQQIGSVEPSQLGTEEPELLGPSDSDSGVIITPLDELDTDNISDVAVADNEYLYGVAGSAGLSIVDVSDPDASERVASMEFELSAHEVAVDGDRLYVLTIGDPTVGATLSDIPRELHVIDISDPTEPETIQTIEDVPSGVPPWQDTVVGDEYVYISNFSAVQVLGESE